MRTIQRQQPTSAPPGLMPPCSPFYAPSHRISSGALAATGGNASCARAADGRATAATAAAPAAAGPTAAAAADAAAVAVAPQIESTNVSKVKFVLLSGEGGGRETRCRLS